MLFFQSVFFFSQTEFIFIYGHAYIHTCTPHNDTCAHSFCEHTPTPTHTQTHTLFIHLCKTLLSFLFLSLLLKSLRRKEGGREREKDNIYRERQPFTLWNACTGQSCTVLQLGAEHSTQAPSHRWQGPNFLSHPHCLPTSGLAGSWN